MRIQVNDGNCRVDCDLCRKACALATGKEPSVYLVQTGSGVQPVLCRQCSQAACAIVCPTGALSWQDYMIGFNDRLCIRCGLCEIACPFGLIQLSQSGAPVKCDLCRPMPAPPCVTSCPEKMLELVK